MMDERRRIWIDLENTPHVPFFIPIIRELEREGFQILLTARDFGQTKALIENAELNARIVGGEYGNATVGKAAGLFSRAFRLAWFLKGFKIDLAIGHGSRGLVLAAKMMGVRALTLYDYEAASVTIFNHMSYRVMTPEIIPFERLAKFKLEPSKHLTYPGLKEEVYVADFKPSDTFERQLELDQNKIIISIRPPSETAHYRSNESLMLFEDLMQMLVKRHDCQLILMPRNKSQRLNLRSRWIMHPNVTLLEQAVNGLDLLFRSDLLIGGGGTMNREAAVLGVPVVSIFKGPEGAVDEYLIAQGKLKMIDKAEQVLPLVRKRERHDVPNVSTKVRDTILAAIRDLSQDTK